METEDDPPVQFKTANLVVNVVMCNLAHGAWGSARRTIQGDVFLVIVL